MSTYYTNILGVTLLKSQHLRDRSRKTKKSRYLSFLSTVSPAPGCMKSYLKQKIKSVSLFPYGAISLSYKLCSTSHSIVVHSLTKQKLEDEVTLYFKKALADIHQNMRLPQSSYNYPCSTSDWPAFLSSQTISIFSVETCKITY